MILRAHAKINLGLAVLDERPDGYHDISTVMQSIGLYDELRISLAGNGEGDKITLTCSEPSLPTDEHNLAYRGAALLMQKAGVSPGVSIHIQKGIPMEAGMAGGSADGAAALVGVNELLHLGLSREELCRVGVRLGADVPFCLVGGAMLCEGIGEVMTPVPSLPPCTILVVKPADRVSTGEAYRGLGPYEAREHLDMAPVLRALQEGDLPGLGRSMANSFEPGVCRAHPVVAEILSALSSLGAEAARMSGSGPTVFGLFAAREQAEAALSQIRSRFPEAFTVLTSPAGAGILISDP